jgi:hypothetical protein
MVKDATTSVTPRTSYPPRDKEIFDYPTRSLICLPKALGH